MNSVAQMWSTFVLGRLTMFEELLKILFAMNNMHLLILLLILCTLHQIFIYLFILHGLEVNLNFLTGQINNLIFSKNHNMVTASMYISTLQIVMEQYHGTYFYKEKMLYNNIIKKQTYYDYTLTLI